MVDVLGPLSARPPTPPRTASRMLSEQDRTEDSPVPVQTPNESPFLQAESTGAPSSRQSKRVNFSPWPKFIKPPSFTNTKSKALLPSNDRKPTRSILKATNSPGPVSPAGVISYTPETFAMLLESVTQQLAGESTSSRIDAYMQFFGALRAYEQLPTEEEIVRKLGLIAQFIQRDIGRDLTKGGPLDTNVVIQALKLSVVLVWHPQISPELPDDFKLFLVDHSVSCLEDGKLPKSVMTHYLTLLATQKFSPKIITTARTIRILEMLHGLTDRVKGNSVVSQRLLIYERVFEVSKSTFIAHSPSWMDHLLSGLLHQMKNVRICALELGFNAYMASGANSTLSKTLRDIFDRTLPNKRKLVFEISERMSRMMANQETGEHVPQIWGVITLLLRNKRFNIYQWQHFKEWVLILQKCFNCSDPEIKSKAIGNWNRFVLVVNINETTSRSLLRMLSKPILSQFERKKHDKSGSPPGPLVVASYYNLLYYAFRPDAPHQQFDSVWEEYIASPSSKIFSFVPSLSDRLAHALSVMLWSSQPLKAWSENRVNEPKRIVTEELPPLDSKWVRSRIPAVLQVFEDIFKSSVWDSELEMSNIAAAWVSLSLALAFAASKEITPSPESMQTVAHVLGLLQRLWSAGPSSLNAVNGTHSKDAFFDRFKFLSTTMIVSLGSIPFTEKLLLKTANSTYQAATPTHRHSKASNKPDSPIFHLLRLVADVPATMGPTTAYSSLINDIVKAACHGKTSRSSQLDILRQCANIYPDEKDASHLGSDSFARIVWVSAAQLSVDCLSAFPTEPAREREGSVGRDYDNVCNILSIGLNLPVYSAVWSQLMDTFFQVLRNERGYLAVATKIIEPFAGLMVGVDVHKAHFPASSIINNSLSIPFFDYEGMVSSNQNSTTPPFPSALIGMACRVLSESYAWPEPYQLDGAATFLESVVSFLGSGTFVFRAASLEKLQVPVGLFVKDESDKLAVESDIENRLSKSCRDLSSAVLSILQFLPHDFPTLRRFESIICSGLRSSHLSTAERFQSFWMSSFETQRTLLIPTNISQALQDLHTRKYRRESELEAQQSQSKTHIENGEGDTTILATESSNVASQDEPAKSGPAFVLDAPTEDPFSAALEPYSAIAPETGPSALQETTSDVQEAAFQQALHNHDEGMIASGNENAAQHKEMFSMIDNLRSSSPPTTTPRELGFMTPPHIRSLRNVESGSETPQTPTIPAVPADNEDGFLGSSPTPAIRGRTSSAASAVPPAISAAAETMDIDPPSSPPQQDSQSADSRQTSPSKGSAKDKSAKNKKRNRPRRSKTPNKDKSASSQSQKEQDAPNEANETSEATPTLRSRLRSAADKSPAANEETPSEKVQETPVPNQPGQNSTADSTSKPRTAVTNPERPDAPVDEASEDTDTQATSQLEHDLVYAVDLGVDADAADKQAAEYIEKAAVTRKRKREGENWTTMFRKERRRSSRISSTPAAEVEGEESQSVRSKKQKLAPPPQEVTPSPAKSTIEESQSARSNSKKQKDSATSQEPAPSPAKTLVEESQSTRSKKQKDFAASQEPALSPAPPSSKKRRHEAAEPTAPIETPKRAKNDKAKKDQDAETEKSDTQDSQKRRSGRISGVPAPDIPEETPPPKKFPKPSSARKQKQNKKQRNRRSERRRSQAAEGSGKEGTPAEEGAREDVGSQVSTADESSAQRLERTSAQLDESELQSIQEEPAKEREDVDMEEVQESEQPLKPAAAEFEAETVTEAQPAADLPQNTEPAPEIESQGPSEPVQKPQPSEPEQQPNEPEAPQPNPDAQISTSLRSLIDQVKSSSLDRDAVKEMDDLLFDLRFEMHQALRRHRDTGSSPGQ